MGWESLPRIKYRHLKIPNSWPNIRKNDIKAKRIILKGVKDHIIPNLYEKKTTYEMFKAILDFPQGTSDVKKLAPKEKLRSINMCKGEPIICSFYFF